MQQGDFINVFLARHVLGTYAHHQEQWRTEGGFGMFNPPPEILKTLQNRAELNPIVKTVKNC